MKIRNASIVAGCALAVAAVAVSQDAMDEWSMPAVKPAEHQIAPAFDPENVDMDA